LGIGTGDGPICPEADPDRSIGNRPSWVASGPSPALLDGRHAPGAALHIPGFRARAGPGFARGMQFG